MSHNAYAVLVSENRDRFEQVLEIVLDEIMPWQRSALLSSIE
ncbi:hypothetical protein [Streptomyces lanatus]|uniref:Transposase n=1 Tax=Streptomyces lanatus TaxID=66900 RepID=A0ABV1Y768_9ACTN|nr:hypothetical protein [Streptomyces lanatus]